MISTGTDFSFLIVAWHERVMTTIIYRLVRLWLGQFVSGACAPPDKKWSLSGKNSFGTNYIYVYTQYYCNDKELFIFYTLLSLIQLHDIQ